MDHYGNTPGMSSIATFFQGLPVARYLLYELIRILPEKVSKDIRANFPGIDERCRPGGGGNPHGQFRLHRLGKDTHLHLSAKPILKGQLAALPQMPDHL